MLTRRAVVGKLAVGAAAAMAWAAGGAGPSVAAVRRRVEVPPGKGEGRGSGAPGRAASAARLPVPEALPEAIEVRPPGAGTAPPWELLRPLRVGTAVGHGWRVADLSGVADGVCVLTLRNGRGRTHRVHLCGKVGRPRGLVYTRRVDMVVMNGGRGDMPTDEGLAQAVAAVAHVLAANERRRQHEGVVAQLMPHAERVRRYAAAGDGRLR